MKSIASLPIRQRRFLEEAKVQADAISNRLFADMYYTSVENMILRKDSTLFEFMKNFERPPVDIETFIDSPEFLGATDIKIWPEVRKTLIELNRHWWTGIDRKSGGKAYNGATLMGATGTAKSTISMLSTMYHLYLLDCLKNPQAVYGLPKNTSIVFAIMAAKPNVMKKVIYVPMRKFICQMPYFQKHMLPDKLIESEMYFVEKNIRIVPAGGDEDAILGEAVIGGIVDEINFMNVVLRSKKAEVTSGRAGLYDQAEQVHSTMVRRKRGRFTRPGPMIGIVFASSSTRYKGDFTDKIKALVDNGTLKSEFVYNRRQFDVVPPERFVTGKFRFMIGNDVQHDSRVLRDDEKAPDGAWIIEVPREYLDDFMKKPYDAMRDVLGISNNALSPFIKTRHKVSECVEKGLEFGLTSFLQKDHVILGEHGMPRVVADHYCTNPSRPRYVHIDLSRNGDRCIAEGQRVLLADRSYRAIDKLRVGDMVVTHDGSAKPVVKLHRNGNKRVLAVDVYGWDMPLRATGNHMVWAVRRSAISYADGRLVKPNDPMFSKRSAKAAKARYNYTPEFVQLDSLRPGDYLVTPRPTTQSLFEIEGVSLNYETGYIAGLFAAEGSFYTHRNREYVQFSLHKNEMNIATQLAVCMEQQFGLKMRAIYDKRSDAVTYRFPLHNQLVDFLRAAVGEYAHRKHLAGAAYGHAQFTAGICHGYVDGDGCVKYDDQGNAIACKTKTVSRAMAEAFYWALTAHGFTPTLDARDAYVSIIHGEEVAHRATYSVSISGADQLEKFRFWSKGEVNVPCSMALALPDYILRPIMGMDDGGTTNVYDITVGDNSSYVVGTSVVHNCGIAMVRFEGMEEVARNNGMKELLPVGVVEMACTISPDANNEIDVAEVRAFVQHLKDKYGYPIRAVTYDNVDSRESIQQWRKSGMRAGQLSVDRGDAAYKQFRDAMYDLRVLLPDNDLLVTEILDLEYDATKFKIDHPVHGTKDCADAVCGAFCSMLERKSSWSAAAADDIANSQSNRAKFDRRFDAPRR